MSINTCTVSGNLTRDPELRATKSGAEILIIPVAVNDRRKNQQTGEWEDYPNYFDCTVFGARAAGLAKVLSKGTDVTVSGKLRYSAWEAQDGSKRSKVEIAVEDIDIHGKRELASQPQQDAPAYPMAQADIPF